VRTGEKLLLSCKIEAIAILKCDNLLSGFIHIFRLLYAHAKTSRSKLGLQKFKQRFIDITFGGDWCGFWSRVARVLSAPVFARGCSKSATLYSVWMLSQSTITRTSKKEIWLSAWTTMTFISVAAW